MKIPASFLLAAALPATALADEALTILRRTESKTGVVWDMPSTPQAGQFLAEAAKQRTALYEQWRLGVDASEALLDQRLAGANLPTVDLKIRTLDPDGKTPRTRVDQGFQVEVRVSGLLSGLDLPPSMSRLLLERQLGPVSASSQPQAAPSRAFIGDNGTTSLSFPASALTAADPTKARGEETFAIHTLAAPGNLPSRLATARVQVLPVASGAIHGIRPGATVDPSALGKLTVSMTDLYPTSTTRLLLFKSRQINGNPSTEIASCPVLSEQCEDRRLTVTDLSSKLETPGTHTLALVSDTIYGRELLCDPITFDVRPPADLAQSSTP